MKLAVIETGGKQYLVQPGQKIKIEKIDGEPNAEVFFDRVLLMADEDDLKIGKPYIENQKIPAKILEQKRDKKITIIKFKPKTRYRKKQGHRQYYTKVEILNF